MSYTKITRLRPADLQEIKLQTSNDAALTDVIKSMQSSVSTQQVPLNTLCPTCQTDGVPQGFIANANSIKTLCPTCKGYLLVHTAQGQLTPPTNPFNQPVTITRIKPADIKEGTNGFPSSTTLSTLITSLQSNRPDGALPFNYDCPLCNTSGWVNRIDTKVLCPVCNGYQKTIQHLQLSDGNVIPVVPTTPPPNPPKPFPPVNS